MKRTYIKPFMESELFVTNEYVAACWKAQCNRGLGTGICDYNNNPVRFDGSNDWEVAVSNYLASYGNTGALHQGDCMDNDIHSGINEVALTYEDSKGYYHSTNVDGVHHELTFKRDTQNHS